MMLEWRLSLEGHGGWQRGSRKRLGGWSVASWFAHALGKEPETNLKSRRFALSVHLIMLSNGVHALLLSTVYSGDGDGNGTPGRK